MSSSRATGAYHFMTRPLERALEFHRAGLNVFPCRAWSKVPCVRWKKYQRARQTESEVEALFWAHNGNVAIVAGSASANLGVVDIEDRRLFEAHVAEFERQYGPTWTVSTARGGHIYFRTTRPVRWQGHKLFEIRGQNHYVLGAGSIHPSGAVYKFRGQPETIACITTLPFCELRFGDSIVPEFFSPAEQTSLPSSSPGWNIVRHYEKRINNYPTLSELDQAIITACVNAGEPLNQIRVLLREAPFPTHYERVLRTQGDSVAEHFLRFSYQKAQSLPDTSAAKSAVYAASRVREWANSRAWPGRSGLTDKAVLLAHATRCKSAKNLDYHLSERDGAQIALVHHVTFGRGTKRLIERGLLKRVKGPEQEDACVYHIDADVVEGQLQPLSVRYCNTSSHGGEDEEVLQQRTHSPTQSASHEQNKERCSGETPTPVSPTHPMPTPTSPTLTSHTHGVFERKALGKAAENVWLAVLQGHATQNQIIDFTGRAKSTVSVALHKLSEHGLITQRDGINTAVIDFDFETLAVELDSERLAGERCARHDSQRRIYRSKLEWQRQRQREGGNAPQENPQEHHLPDS